MRANECPYGDQATAERWHWAQPLSAGALARCQRFIAEKLLISVRESTFREDVEEATDFVIEQKKLTIASRIRKTRHRDLTLRSKLQHGGFTEIDKFRARQGADVYCYGWVDKSDELRDVMLVDMRKFVDSGWLDKPDSERWNYDGKTAFAMWNTETIWDCILYGVTNPGMAVQYPWVVSNPLPPW